MIDPDDRRSNPSDKNAVVGITASSAALVVAQQEADFAVASDHLAGARVGLCITALCSCCTVCTVSLRHLCTWTPTKTVFLW